MQRICLIRQILSHIAVYLSQTMLRKLLELLLCVASCNGKYFLMSQHCLPQVLLYAVKIHKLCILPRFPYFSTKIGQRRNPRQNRHTTAHLLFAPYCVKRRQQLFRTTVKPTVSGHEHRYFCHSLTMILNYLYNFFSLIGSHALPASFIRFQHAFCTDQKSGFFNGVARLHSQILRRTHSDTDYINMTFLFLFCHVSCYLSSFILLQLVNSVLVKISFITPSSSICVIPKHFFPASFKDAPI